MPTQDEWWRLSEVRRLKAAIPRSRTWKEVAELVGTRSPYACSNYAYKHKLGALKPPPRRWTQEEDALLAEEWPKGVDVHRIAKKIGRTSKAVAERARRIGLTNMGRKDIVLRRELDKFWSRG